MIHDKFLVLDNIAVRLSTIACINWFESYDKKDKNWVVNFNYTLSDHYDRPYTQVRMTDEELENLKNSLIAR